MYSRCAKASSAQQPVGWQTLRGVWNSLLRLSWLFIPLILSGCDKSSPAALVDIFPDADAISGWTLSGDAETFDRGNLYDLVDGQADAFFAYGFELVAVGSYVNAEDAVLAVEIWQLATAADAYGLFTSSISGEPATVGNDGDADPGRKLAFWQDRYFVRVRARQELPKSELQRFAEAISAALESGGERPALVSRLPTEGLVKRSAIFFHEEISIQDRLWLGGENLLGLGSETDGVLARYEVGGSVAQLLLVQYRDAKAASAGLAALQDGPIDAVATAEVRDNVLGAVFGPIDAAAASTLLTEALGNG